MNAKTVKITSGTHEGQSGVFAHRASNGRAIVRLNDTAAVWLDDSQFQIVGDYEWPAIQKERGNFIKSEYNRRDKVKQ